jgi:hypothetical protein
MLEKLIFKLIGLVGWLKCPDVIAELVPKGLNIICEAHKTIRKEFDD